LSTPGVPALSDAPIAFQASRAYSDTQTISEQFSRRVAGSNSDKRLGSWLVQTLTAIGLRTHVDAFPATINGRHVSLANVWAVSPGSAPGTVLVIANRDVPAGTTEGADDNASGVAVAIELARVFTAAAHNRTFIFLFTDGDAAGALGAHDFVTRHGSGGMIAAIALRDVGLRNSPGITVDGWSTSARIAPPWLWLLSDLAARSASGKPAALPSLAVQILRLAVPNSSGSQGPFVAAGVPAVTLSTQGHHPDPAGDVLATVSQATLGNAGSTVERMLDSIDASPVGLAASGNSVLLARWRSLSGGAVQVLLVALLIPVAVVTLDLWAQNRRRHAVVWPSWARYGLHLAPWLLVLLVIYAANLLSWLPHSPGAVIPPDSLVARNPRYLRVLLLLAVLAGAYWYAGATEQRLARRLPIDRQSTLTVALAAFTIIAILVFLLNPFSLLLLLPAAILWPLAKPGRWWRSILPVWASLALMFLTLVFFAVHLHIGIRVWWYFFVLFENRSIPATAALLGVAFLATAGMLAYSLRNPNEATATGTKPARRHRHERSRRPFVRRGTTRTPNEP
jgi:hypothetical protein